MIAAATLGGFAEAWPRLKARIAGVFNLLAMLMGIFASFVVRGRSSFVAELLAGLCNIAVTLLLYEISKPVNRPIALLAAFFRPRGIHHWRSRMASSRRRHRPGSLGILWPPDRLPHFPVELPASNPLCVDGPCRLGLATLSIPLQSGRRRPGASIAHSLAPWWMGVNVQRWKEQATAVAERRS
jgi:hypothetical protein